MILQSLLAFAHRTNLLADSDFDDGGRVDFVIRVGKGGALVGLETVERGRRTRIPRQSAHTNALEGRFLVDNARYVLGLGPEKTAGRNALCAATFLEYTQEVARATGDEAVAAVAAFLAQGRREVLKHRPEAEWTGSEVLTFCYDPDETLKVHERDHVAAYWRSLRQVQSEATATCLVTGIRCVPVDLHPKIPLGGSSACLVSFNADSFLSHGLENHEIAPVSREAAEGYVAALRHMLSPSEDRKRYHRQGLKVGDAVLLFWTRDPHPLEDVLGAVLDPPDREAEEVSAALFRRGAAPRTLDATPFYALMISGNQARVIVRDWIESTAAQVLANLERFFADLRIEPGGDEPAPLGLLLDALNLEQGKLHASISAGVLRAALCGHALPRRLLGDAVYQFWTAAPPKKKKPRQTLIARARNQCRVIKAVLARLPNPTEIPVSLDPDRSDVPYLLGRLFAVLENLQRSAAGSGLNASIRDRFNAAPKTPARVFPELLKLSWTHDSKARRADLEKLKGEILGGIQEFPRRLSIEEQGVFMIGYYQQREKLYEKRAKPEAGAPKETE